MKYTASNFTITWRRLGLHALSWAFFIFYELWLLHFSGQQFGSVINYFVQYTINILYFYTVATIPGTFIKAKSAFNFLAALGQLLLIGGSYILLKVFADMLLAPSESLNIRWHYAISYLAPDMIRGAYFSILAVFYWLGGSIRGFRRKQLLAEKVKAELEVRLAESRIAFLQQQLNPHLLFNSLNFIYNSVRKGSPEAARCVELLSELMRYSLDGAGADGKALLSEEIAQVQNLIAVNQFRYQNRLSLETSITGDPALHRIIPLVLLTLTENLFKHGRLNDPVRPASLRLEIGPGAKLTYATSNFVMAKNNVQRKKQLGLESTRTRLSYAYPNGRHTLRITENNEIFNLILMIQL